MAGLCPLPLSLTQAPSGNETSRVECNPNVAIAHSHYHWVGQVGAGPGGRVEPDSRKKPNDDLRCHQDATLQPPITC